MAKSGQWISHQPHPVHRRESILAGAPSSSSRMHSRGQKAAQMPQDLHQSRKISISKRFLFFGCILGYSAFFLFGLARAPALAPLNPFARLLIAFHRSSGLKIICDSLYL